jgi:predicted nucleic acid-binding protein
VTDVVIFDTSVFIDYLRAGRDRELIGAATGLVRTSAVVLSELWRSATKRAEWNFLTKLQNKHPILTPTQNDWLRSGRILGQIYADKGFPPHKLRDLHFDVLIALTARGIGGRLITSDRADFELVRQYQEFKLEIW